MKVYVVSESTESGLSRLFSSKILLGRKLEQNESGLWSITY